MQLLDALGRVRLVHRHRESRRDPGVALLAGVRGAAQVHGHVHAQGVGNRSVPLVVAAKTADDTGDERIVQRSASGFAGLLEFVERDVDQVEVDRQ